MISTGHPEHDRLIRIERVIAREAQAATTRIRQAWDSYRWSSLPSHTQAAAWGRLLSFASHLLGIKADSTKPLFQAVATQALIRWLKMCHIATGNAIAQLLAAEDKPDRLLEGLEKAAIADAISRIFERVMDLEYDLRTPAERESRIRQLLIAFPLTKEHLHGAPPWSLVEELPAIHRLCLEELQRPDGQNAVKDEIPPPWQSRSDASAAHHHTETESV
ncbi:MAG: hypothetical protein ACE37H_04805 [Phycisphaeraceae bacterium]